MVICDASDIIGHDSDKKRPELLNAPLNKKYDANSIEEYP